MWFIDLELNKWDKYLYYIEYRNNPINSYPIKSNFIRACDLIYEHNFNPQNVQNVIKRENKGVFKNG